MHILSEVDTTRIANIIVNEVGIIDDDSKRRILEALDVFIRSKVGDFNRVSKVLDDTLLAYKDLLQQQKELCATIANLRTHTKRLLTQTSTLSNKLAEIENHIKGVDSKLNDLIKNNPVDMKDVKREVEKIETSFQVDEETKKDKLVKEELKGLPVQEDESDELEEEIITSDSFGDEVEIKPVKQSLVKESGEEEEPPQFVKDLIQKLEQEESKKECDSQLTKEEAEKKMVDVTDQPEELTITDNLKDQTDPILKELTFLELVDICRTLNINIPKRCKYNDLLTIISKKVESVDQLLEVVENATNRTVRREEDRSERSQSEEFTE